MSQCRSCHAEIIWALTENGKRIPLDAAAVASHGIFFLDGPPVSDPPLARSAKPVYVSHFATCPNADQHRKER